jgi:hypothetical protein
MRFIHGSRCINCGIFTKEGVVICDKCNTLNPELLAVRFYRRHVMDRPEGVKQ